MTCSDSICEYLKKLDDSPCNYLSRKKIKFLAHLGPEIQKFEKNNIFQKNFDPQNISNFLASKI